MRTRIRNVDLDRARQPFELSRCPERREAAEHVGPIPHFIDPAVFGGKHLDVRCLADGQGRLRGPAGRGGGRRDAAGRRGRSRPIQVECEPLPAVLDAEEALARSAPLLYEEWGDNVVIQLPFVDGDVDAAFADADHVSRTSSGSSATDRADRDAGYVAAWDPRDGTFTLPRCSQNPHPLRWVLANALGIDGGADARHRPPTSAAASA